MPPVDNEKAFSLEGSEQCNKLGIVVSFDIISCPVLKAHKACAACSHKLVDLCQCLSCMKAVLSQSPLHSLEVEPYNMMANIVMI